MRRVEEERIQVLNNMEELEQKIKELDNQIEESAQEVKSEEGRRFGLTHTAKRHFFHTSFIVSNPGSLQMTHVQMCIYERWSWSELWSRLSRSRR